MEKKFLSCDLLIKQCSQYPDEFFYVEKKSSWNAVKVCQIVDTDKVEGNLLNYLNIGPLILNSSESNLFKKILCLMVVCSSPLTKLYLF